MDTEDRKAEETDFKNEGVILRICETDSEPSPKEIIENIQNLEDVCEMIQLPKKIDGRKMKSFDISKDNKSKFLSRINKNSNSSSQLLINSHKKISFVSRSRKNSKMTYKSGIKKSNESIKSNSQQKYVFSASVKLSKKKKTLQPKPSKDILSISNFNQKFKTCQSSKNVFSFAPKDNENNKIGKKIFGAKNYSNLEKNNFLLSGKNSSNVQSESNLKISYGVNLTEKFESNKKAVLNKNESYGCLIDHKKKISDNINKQNGQYLALNQKIMKRNKSHANHFDNKGLLAFNIVPKNANKHNKKNSSLLFLEHKRIKSSQNLIKKNSSSQFLKIATSNDNSQNTEGPFLDKSIEADRDLYNEEHANLYQNEKQEKCENCINLLSKILVACSSCSLLNGQNENLVSPSEAQICENCSKKYNLFQKSCRCVLEIRNRQITFGRNQDINSHDIFGPTIGNSIKNLDNLDHIEEECLPKSNKKIDNESEMTPNRFVEENSSDKVIKENDENFKLLRRSKEELKPDLHLNINNKFQKEHFKNNTMKRNKHQNIKTFFINSPLDPQKNIKYSHKSNQINKSNNAYELDFNNDQNSFLVIDNTSPTWGRINSHNSSKLQIKIHPQKNKSLRKGFANFSKKNIVSSLHKKIRNKLNSSNNTDIFNSDLNKKYPKQIKLSGSHLKSGKESVTKDKISLNFVDPLQREKSHNPFNQKNRYMKRNHTTKNLRAFEFQSNRLNNEDKNKKKQLVNLCKNKINKNKKNYKNNFDISKEKMMKSSLIPSLSKIKKYKNSGQLHTDFSNVSNYKKNFNDSFLKMKNLKLIKNSFGKITTPKNKIKLKNSLNPKFIGEGTLHSLQKVSENEEEGDGDQILVSTNNKKMMRNGSKSLSTGNLTVSNSPDKQIVDKSFRRAETLKRSVAVKQLKIISNEELNNISNRNNNENQFDGENIYNINSEEEEDEDDEKEDDQMVKKDRQTFSQSSTNFKNQYFTLNESDNIHKLQISKQTKNLKKYNFNSHLNSKSLNVSARQVFSQEGLEDSMEYAFDDENGMSISQPIDYQKYLENEKDEVNESIEDDKILRNYKVDVIGSIENFDTFSKYQKKNQNIRKNISLMNSKERRVDKNLKVKEFQIHKMKIDQEKFKPTFSKKIKKLNPAEKIEENNFVMTPNEKEIITTTKKVSENQNPINKQINNKHLMKNQKKSFTNIRKEIQNDFALLKLGKKITKNSIPKDKFSYRNIDTLQQQAPSSKEEFSNDIANNFKKKKINKAKIKKEIKTSNMKISHKFDEKFEAYQHQMKLMKDKLLSKNSEMKQTWMKSMKVNKEFINVPTKLRTNKSKNRIFDPKIVQPFTNKIKQFAGKNEQKKFKKSKPRDSKKIKIKEKKNKTSSEHNIVDSEIQENEIVSNNNSNNNINNTLSKTKSSARLVLMGRYNKQSFSKKGVNRTEKFQELKKLTDSKNLNREEIKETEFKKFLPNYTKYDMLGKGSYAEVFQCHHKDSNDLVAIKIYERYKLLDEIRAENLRNEIDILKMVKHKNIIKFIDHIVGDNLEFVVMEKGPKRMLSEFTKSFSAGRLPNYEAKQIFEQIVEATNYLHKLDICHRDLKLQNILVDERIYVKLIDFGFAVECKKNTKLKVFCGTYSYMAPELVSKIPYDGKATDVWSLGVILYLLILGDYPFKGCDEAEITHNINSLNYYLPSTLESSLIELFHSIFVVDPEKRITADEILSCDWLLIDDAKSFDVKENQSTIFMESTDYI